jgi:transcriptional regulator with XRE-family HTH domain
MEKARISQGELARRVGVSQPTVFGWLNGSEPKAVHYLAVVAILPDAAIEPRIAA